MNKKSEKKKKEKEDKKKKNLALIIAAVVATVVLVVVTVILANFKSDIPEEINDDYFVSDGNKIVLSLNGGILSQQLQSPKLIVGKRLVNFYQGTVKYSMVFLHCLVEMLKY